MAKVKLLLSQILPYFYQLLVIFFIVQSPVALGFQRKCPELSNMAKIKIILSQILPYFYQLLAIFFIVQSPVALGFQRKCPELSLK